MSIYALGIRGTARRVFPLLTLFALTILSAWLAGCAGVGSRKESPGTEAAPAQTLKAPPTAAAAASGRKFEEPGDLDRMLDAKPMDMPAVKPASQVLAVAATQSQDPAKGKGSFRIQIGAESDVDAAQAKKAKYEKMLGGTVDMVFDAPYYKLRWGYFDSKQEAEDKILELSDLKIQGFVIKQ